MENFLEKLKQFSPANIIIFTGIILLILITISGWIGSSVENYKRRNIDSQIKKLEQDNSLLQEKLKKLIEDNTKISNAIKEKDIIIAEKENLLAQQTTETNNRIASYNKRTSGKISGINKKYEEKINLINANADNAERWKRICSEREKLGFYCDPDFWNKR